MFSFTAAAVCPRGDWREKIESEKIAFLTSEMDLTPSEAQAFWPVYNEIQKDRMQKMKAVFDSYKALEDAIAEGKVTEDALRKYTDAVKVSGEIDSKAVSAYLKVIPAEKVASLFVGEEKFRRQQIHRLRGGDGVPGPKQPAIKHSGKGAKGSGKSK